MGDMSDWVLDHYGIPDPDGPRYACYTCGGSGKDIKGKTCKDCDGTGEAAKESLTEGMAKRILGLGRGAHGG